MCKLAWKFGKNIVNLQLETNELGIMVETNNRIMTAIISVAAIWSVQTECNEACFNC